ncbi:MAG: pyrroline-5-carboxylate reductase [Clostridiales bacterium]|nr:pyrroline-5-carboxylate reductase [Clostridiales bacterium]
MCKLGLIGAGNMAGAILSGVIQKGFLQSYEIGLYDVNPSQCQKWQERYSVFVAKDNPSLVRTSEVIMLAVKPSYLRDVLEEIKPHVQGKKIISIAAGWTTAMLTEILDEASGAQVLRVMPNTPAMVGEGYSALCQENTFDEGALSWAKQLFSTLGKVQEFPEKLFDAVIALTGSSPAYAYLFIEAMADGAVKLGMPRAEAYRGAAQAMLGAAKMVLETGEHPGKLKDDVCSPGGTTIEAVYALEQCGFRGIVMNALEACARKSAKMAQEGNKK